MKPRIQCALTQWKPGSSASARRLARPQHYRSISRAMTSCWIWLVPS
jgi:hypothetical protein